MTKWSRITLLLAALVMGACSVTTTTTSTTDSAKGSGNAKTESRAVSGFASVRLETSGMVEVTQGTDTALTIEADDNILPLLTSEVSDGRLTLGAIPNRSIQPTTPILYRLSVATLEQVTIAGSGTVKIGTLNAPLFNLELLGSGSMTVEKLDGNRQLVINVGGSGTIKVDAIQGESVTINLKGSGNVTLTGEVNDQQIVIEGNGRYDGEGLTSANVQMLVGGSGNALVNVRDRLNVEIPGSGSVRYVGQPTVTRNITGSGSVQPKG